MYLAKKEFNLKITTSVSIFVIIMNFLVSDNMHYEVLQLLHQRGKVRLSDNAKLQPFYKKNLKSN